MEIETKVISTEIIKPSSPTPKSLQKHQLSFLDQGAPSVFMPVIYFYSSNTKIPNSQKSNHLKKSLSETLSIFYPLAGRLVDNLYVDCNDSGAPFAVAEANCGLSQVITKPDPERFRKLLLHKLDDESQDFIISVQVTYFRCGGLAVGLLIWHKIGDGLSLLTFSNTWSAVARNGGVGSVPTPKFDAASYFRPEDASGYTLGAGLGEEDVATKFFTFPAARIAALQERYSGGGGGDHPRRRPSRVAALSAYIWSRFLLATGTQGDPTKSYGIVTSVNIRELTDPPMSENHFGNIILVSITTPAAGDGGAEIVQKDWEAKKALNDGRSVEVKAMDVMNKLISLAVAGEGLVSFAFTSLCGFPLYETDFGWGKPVWAGSLGFPDGKNIAVFSDKKSGGGIDVVIHLSKQDMEKFQTDPELQLLKSNL